MLKAKSEVLTAVATNNTQIINNAIKDFVAGTTVVAELSKLATMEKTKAILSTTTEETNALPKILSKSAINSITSVKLTTHLPSSAMRYTKNSPTLWKNH